MNGSTLSSFTVGPWRIMALRPWMNVLWAAAMLLKSREPCFFKFEFQRKQVLHGLIIEHIWEITGWHIYLDVLINVSAIRSVVLKHVRLSGHVRLVFVGNRNWKKHGSRDLAAAHNTFIQGLNAMIRHGPAVKEDNVKPFMSCIQVGTTKVSSCYSPFHIIW